MGQGTAVGCKYATRPEGGDIRFTWKSASWPHLSEGESEADCFIVSSLPPQLARSRTCCSSTPASSSTRSRRASPTWSRARRASRSTWCPRWAATSCPPPPSTTSARAPHSSYRPSLPLARCHPHRKPVRPNRIRIIWRRCEARQVFLASCNF